MRQVPSDSGRLYVCATPIGNLEDVTERVLRALRESDIVACEDTRQTKKLLARYGIKANLISYHQHNERRRAEELVERIKQGQVVALATDSGMPAISDPGLILVQLCMALELQIEVLPGPSAVTAAVVASGIEAESWAFIGFLPRRKSGIEAVLKEESGQVLVAFESPQRLVKTLEVIANCDPGRKLAVCRELTKLHEQVVSNSAVDVLEYFRDGEQPRGEITIVVAAGGKSDDQQDLDKLIEHMRGLVDAGLKPKVAAGKVAEISGSSKRPNTLYKAYLQRK